MNGDLRIGEIRNVSSSALVCRYQDCDIAEGRTHRSADMLELRDVGRLNDNVFIPGAAFKTTNAEDLAEEVFGHCAEHGMAAGVFAVPFFPQIHSAVFLHIIERHFAFVCKKLVGERAVTLSEQHADQDIRAENTGVKCFELRILRNKIRQRSAIADPDIHGKGVSALCTVAEAAGHGIKKVAHYRVFYGFRCFGE